MVPKTENREREREREREDEREEPVRDKGIFTRDNNHNYCDRKGAKGVKQNYQLYIYYIKQMMTERKLKSMHAGVITFIFIR